MKTLKIAVLGLAGVMGAVATAHALPSESNIDDGTRTYNPGDDCSNLPPIIDCANGARQHFPPGFGRATPRSSDYNMSAAMTAIVGAPLVGGPAVCWQQSGKPDRLVYFHNDDFGSMVYPHYLMTGDGGDTIRMVETMEIACGQVLLPILQDGNVLMFIGSRGTDRYTVSGGGDVRVRGGLDRDIINHSAFTGYVFGSKGRNAMNSTGMLGIPFYTETDQLGCAWAMNTMMSTIACGPARTTTNILNRTGSCTFNMSLGTCT